ncbi:S4 domain-containing protein, partial [Glaesserella parasuis]|nr:S4 domain-containing protein [Glaesserella parasuis]
MRLDKFIAENTGLTRSQASKALRTGQVTVNGVVE